MADGDKTPLTLTDSDKKDDALPGDEFEVVDVRDVDATLQLDDGRVFIALIGDKVEKDELKRGARVKITSDGFDKTDAPKGAKITRILPKK